MFLLCDVIGPLQVLVSEPKMKTIPILEWYGDTLPPTISTPHKGNKAPENFPNHLQNLMHCDVPHEICHACYHCNIYTKKVPVLLQIIIKDNQELELSTNFHLRQNNHSNNNHSRQIHNQNNNNNSSNGTSNGNNGAHLLLFKWTPITQSQINNNNSNNNVNGDKSDVAGAPVEPPRRKFKYIPVIIIKFCFFFFFICVCVSWDFDFW